LALAPELRAGPDANRVTYACAEHGRKLLAATSRMQGAQYHGTDQQGQPFTITADAADEQTGAMPSR
jgi:lipopolysaccharide export system protein LptC